MAGREKSRNTEALSFGVKFNCASGLKAVSHSIERIRSGRTIEKVLKIWQARAQPKPRGNGNYAG
jgi:hypothetical protein